MSDITNSQLLQAIGSFRDDAKTEIRQIYENMTKEMKENKIEIKADITSMKDDMSAGFNRVYKEITVTNKRVEAEHDMNIRQDVVIENIQKDQTGFAERIEKDQAKFAARIEKRQDVVESSVDAGNKSSVAVKIKTGILWSCGSIIFGTSLAILLKKLLP